MAASLTKIKSYMSLQKCVHRIMPSMAVGAVYCARSNSNRTSITRTRRQCYPRTYPILLVYPDGSTVSIRHHVPRGILKLPLDFSKLSEEDKRKVLVERKPKRKLEVIEDFDDSFNVSEYSKYFKQ